MFPLNMTATGWRGLSSNNLSAVLKTFTRPPPVIVTALSVASARPNRLETAISVVMLPPSLCGSACNFSTPCLGEHLGAGLTPLKAAKSPKGDGCGILGVVGRGLVLNMPGRDIHNGFREQVRGPRALS
jgi:hypothetical protein